jgi:RNA polymerase sigma factor (sigma-70 family)
VADNANVQFLPADSRFAALSDDELVDAAGRGDRFAMVEFLRRHWNEFRRTAQSRVTGSGQFSHGVDDILSTTVRQVLGMVAKGTFTAQGAGRARGLVALVIRRSIIRTLLTRRRDQGRAMRRALQLPSSGAGSARTSASAPEATERFALGPEVQRLISSLPEADYRLIVMRLQGTSFRAIGESLGCSEEASRQRWKQVRDRLTDLAESH